MGSGAGGGRVARAPWPARAVAALALFGAAAPAPGQAVVDAAPPAPETFECELDGRDGEVLVIDPSDGRLLGLSDARRPFSQAAPAATLAQLVTAYGLLTDPEASPSTRVRCGGPCAGAAGHGDVDVEAALAAGCELFFRDAGGRLGLEKFRRAAWTLGLAPSPDIDYVNGVAVVPAATLRSAVPDLAARGTGVALTPARAAALVAIVATSTSLDAGALAVMRRALARSLSEGEAAAWWREVGGPPAAGKVGTSNGPPAGNGGQSWFIGYAPPDRPRVAVVVLLRGSAADAARAGARLLSRYLGNASETPPPPGA